MEVPPKSGKFPSKYSQLPSANQDAEISDDNYSEGESTSKSKKYKRVEQSSSDDEETEVSSKRYEDSSGDESPPEKPTRKKIQYPVTKHVIKPMKKSTYTETSDGERFNKKWEFSSTDDESGAGKSKKKAASESSSGTEESDEETERAKRKTYKSASTSTDEDDENIPQRKANKVSVSSAASTSTEDELSSEDDSTNRKKKQSTRPPWCSSTKTDSIKNTDRRKPMLAETNVPGFYFLMLNSSQEQQAKKLNARQQLNTKVTETKATLQNHKPKIAPYVPCQQKRARSADAYSRSGKLPNIDGISGKVSSNGSRKVVTFQEPEECLNRNKNMSSCSGSPTKGASTVSLDESETNYGSSSNSRKGATPRILSPIRTLIDESKKNSEKNLNVPSFFTPETVLHFVEKAKELIFDIEQMSRPFLNEIKSIEETTSEVIVDGVKNCVTSSEDCIDFNIRKHEIIPGVFDSPPELGNIDSVDIKILDESSAKTVCKINLDDIKPISCTSDEFGSKSEPVSSESKNEVKNLIREYKKSPDSKKMPNKMKKSGKKGGVKSIFKGFTSMFKRKKNTPLQITVSE